MFKNFKASKVSNGIFLCAISSLFNPIPHFRDLDFETYSTPVGCYSDEEFHTCLTFMRERNEIPNLSEHQTRQFLADCGKLPRMLFLLSLLHRDGYNDDPVSAVRKKAVVVYTRKIQELLQKSSPEEKEAVQKFIALVFLKAKFDDVNF